MYIFKLDSNNIKLNNQTITLNLNDTLKTTKRKYKLLIHQWFEED